MIDTRPGRLRRAGGATAALLLSAALMTACSTASTSSSSSGGGEQSDAQKAAQAKVEPIYEDIEGWSGTTAGARSWADLPAQAIKYVRRIEELIGAPVALLSTSPERDDTILMHSPFED